MPATREISTDEVAANQGEPGADHLDRLRPRVCKQIDWDRRTSQPNFARLDSKRDPGNTPNSQ